MIVLGVVAWGLVLAAGAYWRHDDRFNPIRPLVVFATVGGFLAWWLWLLNSRRGRELAEQARKHGLHGEDPPPAQHGGS